MIAPMLDGGPVALIDYPDHSNVGDSAIWLGEVAFFGSRGVQPVYCSALKNHSDAALAAALPEGTIFLHGGGNFGTLWKAHQDFRLDILERFPRHRVVQLPQSIHFEDEAAAAETQRAIARHGRFTLFVRDRPSMEYARRLFDCEVKLAPDMAFAIGPLERKRSAVDIFYLLRTDLEKMPLGERRDDGRSALAGDWLAEDRHAMRLVSMASRLMTLMDSAEVARLKSYERLASARVRRGIELLSTGRVVVTDRLHGHILSTLLGIPHVALDNSYRKIGNFIDAWTHDLDIVRVAGSLDEAASEAGALLDQEAMAETAA